MNFSSCTGPPTHKRAPVRLHEPHFNSLGLIIVILTIIIIISITIIITDVCIISTIIRVMLW
jgi:hypothetical protein